MSPKTSIHGAWSSRGAFVLAATGSAVGLGNIWKFPYITGENGGGAFVLVYLFCIAVIGIPIMMAEIMLGRRGRQSPINTMETLAIESGHNPNWKLLGAMGVIAGFLILSYYSVVAGWAMDYIFRAASGEFTGQTAQGIANKFDSDLLGSPKALLFWHTLFMVMTMIVVTFGVKSGLEKAVKFLMPTLLVLLLILLGYAMNTDSFGKSVEFLFTPNFDKLTWRSVLVALGHAFFTLSLGMGAIMVYGSYLPKRTSITKTTLMITAADTLVALLACLIIFTIVFDNNLKVNQNEGLAFKTMPLAFGQMEGGVFFGTLFFVLLAFAAWTSAISLLEPAVTWLVEKKGFTRMQATLISGILIWLTGILTVLSFQDDSPIRFTFNFAGQEMTKGFFHVLDILTANFMLPIGGILIAIFAGWLMSRDSSRDELELGEGALYITWRFLIRYIAPTLVLLVILNQLGVIEKISHMFATVPQTPVENVLTQ